jgi:hypothetical protein
VVLTGSKPDLRRVSLGLVQVEKLKWDGDVVARDEGVLLERSDALVAWVVPAGSVREHPHRETTEDVPATELWLAPRRCSWVARLLAESDGPPDRVIAHASLPIEAEGARLSWVDLDLDLHLDRSGSISLRDIGDFATRAQALGYSEEAIRAAWLGIGDAGNRLSRSMWPFDETLDELLRRAARLAPAPALSRR